MAAPVVRMILAKGARNSAIFSSSGRNLSTGNKQNLHEEKEELDKNSFYDKYAQKLKKAQSSDPAMFQSKLNDLQESRQETKWRDEPQCVKTTRLESQQPRLLKSSQAQAFKQDLDSIMKMELIQNSTKEEIQRIWTQYHSKKDCISAVIPSTIYKKIYRTAQENPLFLYPLPRKTGYEFFFAQFDNSNHICFFTSLINYQAYQENAPILLSLKHFTELQKEKDIVLMRGEMDTSMMSVQDAQFLANQLQLYYATDDPYRLKLLQTFNHHQDQFKHMDVIAQLEKCTVDLPRPSTEKNS